MHETTSIMLSTIYQSLTVLYTLSLSPVHIISASRQFPEAVMFTDVAWELQYSGTCASRWQTPNIAFLWVKLNLQRFSEATCWDSQHRSRMSRCLTAAAHCLAGRRNVHNRTHSA